MYADSAKNRCRICLVGGKKLHSIFEQQGSITVAEKIMSIAQVMILYRDTLPHFICHKCLVRLKHCYAFKLMCERSDKKLRKRKTYLNETFTNNFSNEIKIDVVEIKSENITTQNVLLPNYKETHSILNTQLERLPKSEEHVSKYKDSIYKCDDLIPACEEHALHTESIEGCDNEESLDYSDVDNQIIPKISAVKIFSEINTIEESEESNETHEESHSIPNMIERDSHSETPLLQNEVKRQRQKERPGNSEEDEKCDTHVEISDEGVEVENEEYTRKPNKNQPSQCHECDKVLSSKDSLVIHMRTHSGLKPYSCTYCNKAFSTLCVCQRHERIHTGEKPFGCSTCDKKFAWESSRAQHERIHSGDNRYKCDLCLVSFPTAAQLSYHRRKHTGERYKCEKCEKSYISPGDLAAHVRTKHDAGRKYVCSVCGGAFFRADHLKRHMKLHDEKPFRAIAEKKRTDVPSSSEEHGSSEKCSTSDDTAPHVKTRLTSVRERQHVCSTCGSRFYRPDHLKRHMKLHDSNIPFIVVTKKTPDGPDCSV